MCIYIYTYVYIYMYVYRYVYVYIYIYMTDVLVSGHKSLGLLYDVFVLYYNTTES